jgi:hypothetical protein
MPKFRVRKKIVKYETVLVNAATAEEASDRVRNAAYWDRFESDPNSRDTPEVAEVVCMGEVETGAKQFDFDRDMWKADPEDDYAYTFSGAMVSTCEPLLDDCEDNHDVTRLLKKKHVVRKGTESDPESCSVYFYFKTKSAAQSFIKRLNKFLAKRYDESRKGKRFKVDYAA